MPLFLEFMFGLSYDKSYTMFLNSLPAVAKRIRHNHLAHYFYHFIIATVFLCGAIGVYGSVTPWELFLFIFMSYLPIIDEFLYAVIHYFEQPECRTIVHTFLVGDLLSMAYLLHTHRKSFTRLTLHNIPFYVSTLSLLYAAFVFDAPLLVYTLIGLIVHLCFDMLNDVYEFGSVRKWLWPFSLISV